MTTAQITTHSSPQGDLDWRAFCYLSEELSPAERAQFEAELATDLTACEALARMTQVTLATSQLLREQSVPCRVANREETSRPQRFLGVALATAALVFVGVQLFSRPALVSTPQAVSNLDRVERAATLIASWNLNQTKLDAEILEETDDLSEEFSTLRPAETVDLADDRAEVPTWMIAALTLEDASAQADPSSEMKDN